jgi:hypothetical protein
MLIDERSGAEHVDSITEASSHVSKSAVADVPSCNEEGDRAGLDFRRNAMRPDAASEVRAAGQSLSADERRLELDVSASSMSSSEDAWSELRLRLNTGLPFIGLRMGSSIISLGVTASLASNMLAPSKSDSTLGRDD